MRKQQAIFYRADVQQRHVLEPTPEGFESLVQLLFKLCGINRLKHKIFKTMLHRFCNQRRFQLRGNKEYRQLKAALS